AHMGTTPDDIRRWVRAARETVAGAPTLLVVDPLQRLYASERGNMTGRALERVNAEETDRVGAVAAQLKEIADQDDIAILFLSDTTKENVRTSGSSATGLRGSYALNHWATAIFGLQVAPTPEALATRLHEAKVIDDARTFEESLRGAMPSWWD